MGREGRPLISDPLRDSATWRKDDFFWSETDLLSCSSWKWSELGVATAGLPLPTFGLSFLEEEDFTWISWIALLYLPEIYHAWYSRLNGGLVSQCMAWERVHGAKGEHFCADTFTDSLLFPFNCMHHHPIDTTCGSLLYQMQPHVISLSLLHVACSMHSCTMQTYYSTK